MIGMGGAEWSGEKSRIPFNRKPLLYYLISVRRLRFSAPGRPTREWRSRWQVCQAWLPHDPEECAANPPATRHHI